VYLNENGLDMRTAPTVSYAIVKLYQQADLHTRVAGSQIVTFYRPFGAAKCYLWLIGAWRSPVAHCTGGAEVTGSNPVAPTI
jgi:hypothetical protein